MKTLRVNLDPAYEIRIGAGLLDTCGTAVQALQRVRRVLLVTDSQVGKLYADRVTECLKAAGLDVFRFTFEAGEASKTPDTVLKIAACLADHGFCRTDLVAALGGGVTGDLAGFAAAIYMRGIRFVQLSTSLLSDVDSSVGGKTGCDLFNGKNLLGCFHQPSLVLIDTDVLKTLPRRFWSDGSAEAIKCGLIRSESLWNLLSHTPVTECTEEVIYQCVDIKRKIVEADEKESGERKLLNFGHTLAHAIEKAYNYTTYTHGEAVGLGMLAVTKAAENHGLCEPGLAEKIHETLRFHGLVTSCDAPLSSLLPLCISDKKRTENSLDLVLVKKPGQSFIYRIAIEELPRFFDGVELK